MLLPWTKREPDRNGQLAPRPALISRRESLLQGTMGLAAALALAGCAVPEGETVGTGALKPEEHLRHALDSPTPVVAGETLDGALLRRFYTRRNFVPVWTTRQPQAEAFKALVLRARDHGLDPELFQADLLRRLDTLPPDRRDLLLSHAVLTYAQALAVGAVPQSRRKDQEALAPEPVDVAEVLDKALNGPDPTAVIEALAPQTPTYLALRQALQRVGSAGRPDQAEVRRLRVIEANLERQRWLPREMPANRVWVNVPEQQLVLYRDNRPVFVTRVVVGETTERKQSPEFSAIIESTLFNPPWVIPEDIVEADIRPMLKRDPLYLVKNNIVMLPNGDAEQAPGPQAGLGAVMFEMPNRFDVYLHDTPGKDAFNRDNRRLSNGCIRVHNPMQFAALLMDEPLATINKNVATRKTVRKSLAAPVPVFVLYHTAFAAAGRELEMRPDFYGRDESLWQRLQKRPREQGTPGSTPMASATARAAPAAGSARRSAPVSSPRPVIPGRT